MNLERSTTTPSGMLWRVDDDEDFFLLWSDAMEEMDSREGHGHRITGYTMAQYLAMVPPT